ncbi:hypothetical protein [Paenarthrobacter aurescens]|uniref:Uncharacterized protein n=1 Tax=Paenarthrobacter aurescens TaxID=43663 RepID=A0A4Y3NHD0_PAEAU|nr:hypothetical protein [Paenarthrobacter aurescens]MDO6142436.1 hypothetical protein [Paenarthrobacter aurescens]MDO6146283.1 hypothetical protein [Paenarthrobacter aurescens]MDO6157528.1 hypothetical protein [Paenarthrobacter aurescens]MDO6161513.1 hypothetical protein [Paenarthrobacter aurescens]GEB20623.1 hypothetical protein AAU01_33780 [Paenarthrobacter aurescens]
MTQIPSEARTSPESELAAVVAEALKLADAQLVVKKSFAPFVFMLDADGTIHRGEVPHEIQGSMPPDPMLSVKLTIDFFSGHAGNLLAMVAVLDPQASMKEDTLHLWAEHRSGISQIIRVDFTRKKFLKHPVLSEPKVDAQESYVWNGDTPDPAEEWWHEGLSEQAIQDVFKLVGAAVPFAQDQLGRNGSLAPYGLTSDLSGEIGHHMAYQDANEDDEVDSAESVQMMTEGFRQKLESLRGTCIISDVRLTPSSGEGVALDALRLHIEHTEGLSMLLLKPYEIDEQSQTVAFGETAVIPTPAQVWSV